MLYLFAGRELTEYERNLARGIDASLIKLPLRARDKDALKMSIREEKQARKKRKKNKKEKDKGFKK